MAKNCYLKLATQLTSYLPQIPKKISKNVSDLTVQTIILWLLNIFEKMRMEMPMSQIP